MNAAEKKAQVRNAILGRLPEVWHDISVPKVLRWTGLQPVPQQEYRVEYHDDAANVLRGVANSDSRLYPLRRRLRIEVDLSRHVAHVFLDS